MTFVIITGSPHDGFRAYGPYPDERAANAEGIDNPAILGPWWVMPVYPLGEFSLWLSRMHDARSAIKR